MVACGIRAFLVPCARLRGWALSPQPTGRCWVLNPGCALAAAGYREAAEVARTRLEKCAFDHKSDPVAFRQDLLNIACTTLSSKILTQVRRASLSPSGSQPKP